MAMIGLLLAVLALTLAACSGGDSDGVGDSDVQTTAVEQGAADAHEDADADAHEGGHEDSADANAALADAPADLVVELTMTNFAFGPNVLEVNAGDVIEFQVENTVAVPHDFNIDEVDADLLVSYLPGSGEHGHAADQVDADVHFALTEQGTGLVYVRVHEPGEYVFYCSVPGHRDLGMEGRLIVN